MFDEWMIQYPVPMAVDECQGLTGWVGICQPEVMGSSSHSNATPVACAISQCLSNLLSGAQDHENKLQHAHVLSLSDTG